MILPDDPYELAAVMSRRLDGQLGALGRLDGYFTGSQPASLMSAASLAALSGALPTLSVNLCRLSILSLIERLKVTGVRLGDSSESDPEFWRTWARCGLDRGSDQIHSDALTHGRAYAIVWTNDAGNTIITPEPATQTTAIVDPATGVPVCGLKRWTDVVDPEIGAGVNHATLFLADRVLSYLSEGSSSGFGPWQPGAWELVDEVPNPLGRPPIVRFLNGRAPTILGPEGDSELDDLVPIVDLLAKTLQDAAVASEVGARPRRWITGLEVQQAMSADGTPVVDDEGQPVYVDPFSSSSLDARRVWQVEPVDAKVGQFPSVDLQPYTSMVATLLQAAGAVSCLPSHYLSIVSAQPPSADALRASESSLVSRSFGKMRAFAPSWREVVQLETALRDGRDWRSIRAEVQWSNPATPTPAQAGDEASKLSTMGVPLTTVLSEVLGWSPEQINSMRRAKMAEALDRTALQPPRPDVMSTPPAAGPSQMVGQ